MNTYFRLVERAEECLRSQFDDEVARAVLRTRRHKDRLVRAMLDLHRNIEYVSGLVTGEVEDTNQRIDTVGIVPELHAALDQYRDGMQNLRAKMVVAGINVEFEPEPVQPERDPLAVIADAIDAGRRRP